MLNIAYSILCGGQVLDDIEVRRNDAAFLDTLGAWRPRDPRPDRGRQLLPPLRRRGDLAADACHQPAWIAHGSRRFRTWL
ncbi:MAG TPA: hypothetical protein VKZ49_06975, partial [Polyangiaceae bacterium]|nr:hypothetical protein [Polyangiaceae bacterium]